MWVEKLICNSPMNEPLDMLDHLIHFLTSMNNDQQSCILQYSVPCTVACIADSGPTVRALEPWKLDIGYCLKTGDITNSKSGYWIPDTERRISGYQIVWNLNTDLLFDEMQRMMTFWNLNIGYWGRKQGYCHFEIWILGYCNSCSRALQFDATVLDLFPGGGH